jgi:hypothetical protein
MKLKLKIIAVDTDEYTQAGRRFRFAIVDSDKPDGYPRNFICLLPSRVTEVGKSKSAFLNIFGNSGFEQAERLLTEALRIERNAEIKNEIERRLELLNPKTLMQRECNSCGKVFELKHVRKYSRYLCQECMNKRYSETR